MSKVVFVLGAGASAHCGTPLMDNFLEVAQDLLRMGEVEEAREDFENVFDAIGYLHSVHSKSRLDTNNIESVYTAFEMGKLIGRLPGVKDESRIDKLIHSIKKVIGYTLEKTTRLPKQLDASEAYYQFAGIIMNLLMKRTSCAIITFNYDLGLDYALYKKNIQPDYSLKSDTNFKDNIVPCLKLHGSLNWGECERCKRIIPYSLFRRTPTGRDRSYSIIPIISLLKETSCKDCGKRLKEDPVIIPPTWNKTGLNSAVKAVWRRAANELRDAQYIFVLGYSLPDTDWFFNYLFALGVDMTTSIREFYVANPNIEVLNKFKNMLGQGVTKYTPEQTTFEKFVLKPNPLWKWDDPDSYKIRVFDLK